VPVLTRLKRLESGSDRGVPAAAPARAGVGGDHGGFRQGRQRRTDVSIGRFGWKAQTSTLVKFMGQAFRDEIGLTNPLAPRDLVRGCGASSKKPEADAASLTSIAAFLNTIDPPVPTAACLASAGGAVFNNVGCATCHTPTMPGPGDAGPVPTTIRLARWPRPHDFWRDPGARRAGSWRRRGVWGAQRVRSAGAARFPQLHIADTTFTHGMEIGVARNETHDLDSATSELIDSLDQTNPATTLKDELSGLESVEW
jgi:hypothetical protein